MTFGKLFSTPNNGRSAAILAVAKANNLDLEVVHTETGANASADYLKINKLGKVPTFVGADGYILSECMAIAIYLTSQNEKTTLLGKTKKDYASILRWMSFANTEILPPIGSWFRPLVGREPFNKKNVDESMKAALKAIHVLEEHFLVNTYLVGERLTLADLFTAGVLYRGFQYFFDKKWREENPNVFRWYETIVNQPIYSAVTEKIQYIDTAIPNQPPKKEQPPKQKEQPKKKEEPKPKKKVAEEEEEEEEDKPAPKPKHPLEALGRSTFVLDDWKRKYSNEETREVALPWFWDNANFEEYSLWRVDYKYNDELTQVFMTSNLIGGFFNRLEASRKYIFGAASVFGKANDSIIRGAFFIRGQEALPAFDVAPDYESYEFVKLDPKKADDKAFIEDMWAWDKPIEVNGKTYEWADGKVFKHSTLPDSIYFAVQAEAVLSRRKVTTGLSNPFEARVSQFSNAPGNSSPAWPLAAIAFERGSSRKAPEHVFYQTSRAPDLSSVLFQQLFVGFLQGSPYRDSESENLFINHCLPFPFETLYRQLEPSSRADFPSSPIFCPPATTYGLRVETQGKNHLCLSLPSRRKSQLQAHFMKDNHGAVARRSGGESAAIQVICLGSGGGPSEDNVTGFLVRSISSDWSKGSLLAVDAGSHLAAIQRILENHFPVVSANNHANALPIRLSSESRSTGSEQSPENESEDSNESETPEPVPEAPITTLESGPFAGLPFPHASARANAVHIVREHVSTYLITHPHLDHLSGFAINTAAFHNTSRPKRLAALPFTVNAIKAHIFNDIIWPNLTDEDNGVGFVTFQRLTEGGNLALGDGNSRGFIEVCDGLAAKGFKVSHGRCAGTSCCEYGRRGSGANMADPGGTPQHTHSGHAHGYAHTQHTQHNGGAKTSAPTEGRRASVFTQPSQPSTPTFYGQQNEYLQCVVDSSAFFIRADDTGREILIFGDVEPDGISALPRTHVVWAEAAPKIAQGILSGIFIECSYNDSQQDAVLFGHLAPRHLIKELETLAEMVAEKRKEGSDKVGKKRKRWSHQHGSEPGPSSSTKIPKSRSHRADTPGAGSTNMDDLPVSISHATLSSHVQYDGVTTSAPQTMEIKMGSIEPVTTRTSLPQFDGPLKGVRVIVIHVKDTMTDGPLVGESILQELWAHEARLAKEGKALGCVFEISTSGASYWF